RKLGAEEANGLVSIPRPKGRGLIEGTGRPSTGSRSSTIPRPKGRGLIEGSSSWLSPPSAARFLDRKVEASLKDHVAHGRNDARHEIPRPKGRGLIEGRRRGRRGSPRS